MPKLYSTTEIAERLGVHPRTISLHVSQGKFGTVEQRGGDYRISIENLITYMGVEQVDVLFLDSSAYVLARQSKSGVPFEAWEQALAVLKLFHLVNPAYWPQALEANGLGNPGKWSQSIGQFLRCVAEEESDTVRAELCSDDLYNEMPPVLRRGIDALKV